MSRDDLGFVGNTQFGEHLPRLAHGRPIRPTSHHYPDQGAFRIEHRSPTTTSDISLSFSKAKSS